MTTNNPEEQKLRLERLGELLRDIWAAIAPTEKRRAVILFKFKELEKRVQVARMKMDLILKKGNANK